VLGSRDVVAFVATRDSGRARAFYEGVCTFPGGARVAWFKDPDGNTLSLTEGGTRA
jgi:hypothetical protein